MNVSKEFRIKFTFGKMEKNSNIFLSNLCSTVMRVKN